MEKTVSVNEPLDWDELVVALRAELREKHDLLCLLNQQTEALYRRDLQETHQLEEQIRKQTELAAQGRRATELLFHSIAVRLQLPDGALNETILAQFPPYVQPFLESLRLEVDTLSSRLGSRILQNQDLKARLLTSPSVKTS
ncbi:MAG TPA: hypothetical protein VGD78_13135 [Chthoniobacterales bacterium]